MKKGSVFFGVMLAMAMVLVFGVTVVGCDNDPPPAEDDDVLDNRPFLLGAVQFSQLYPVVGETITVNYVESSGDPLGTPSWKWYKTQENALSLSNVTNKTLLGSGTTYTVQQNDKDFWIWAEVSYSGNQGTIVRRMGSTVTGIPTTATVSVSIKAERRVASFVDNHRVTVTLTLSDGRWNSNIYSDTGKQWVTMSGVPSSASSWLGTYATFRGRELILIYETRLETTPTINLTATLNTAQLGTMRDNTNVTSTLTAGTTTASVSQWTEGFY